MQKSDLDEVTTINGEEVRLRDIPYPLSAMFGIGHPPVYKRENRQVYPGRWPYTPENCQLADEQGNTTWMERGTILVCDGCGLDVT